MSGVTIRNGHPFLPYRCSRTSCDYSASHDGGYGGFVTFAGAELLPRVFRDASRAQFQLTTRCLGNCGRRIPTGTRKGRCKWCRRKLDAARNEVAALRPIVLARDGYECQLRLPGCTGRATTADHIVPLSKGGGNELSNMRAACLPCNSGRGNRA